MPAGLALFGAVLWLSGKPVLGEDEKSRVIELMASFNALDDEMNHYFNELIDQKGDKVARYQNMLNSTDFKELWEKCSIQRAYITAISPELGERIRLLLTLMRTYYSYLLKDWSVSESYKFTKAIEEHIRTTEAIRQRIRKINERLMG